MAECNIISGLARRFLGRDTYALPCCEEHDFAYQEAGTRRDRWKADNRLLICVVELGYPKLGILMWVAVRLFGWRHWGDQHS